MKILNKVATGLLTAGFATGLAFNFSGCSKAISPNGPAEITSKNQNKLNILSVGDIANSLKKEIVVSKRIKRNEGGLLHLEYKILKRNGKEVKVDIKLTIHKNSIPQDDVFVMSIDSKQFLGNLDVTFGPHGTQFSIPADLDIEIEGLDLSGLNFKKIKVYYDNQKTGQWEVMKVKEIKFDKKEGEIEVKKAKLPHFSRYALAHSE